MDASSSGLDTDHWASPPDGGLMANLAPIRLKVIQPQ